MKTFILLCALLAAGLPDSLMPTVERAPLKFPGQFPGQFPVHPVTEFFLKHLSNGQEAISRPTPTFFAKTPWRIFSAPT